MISRLPERALFTFLSVACVGLGIYAVTLAQPGLPKLPPPPVQGNLLPDVNTRPLVLSETESTNVKVYQQVNGSVVNITTKGVDDSFLLLPPTRQGSGSGCVLSQLGHILTNYHVVEGSDEINVTLSDGSSFPARIIGTDPNNDLAVLRIDAPREKLKPIPWGDSDQLSVGVHVYAIGNPFGLERTMTSGMVSSLGRTLKADNGRLIRDVIQTDAAINPGNSGGPLLNTRGELVGITTAIIGKAGQNSGVGLAVPGNTARRVSEELIRFGKVVRPDAGIEAAYRTEKGLLIARLTENGAAERAGLRGPEVRVLRRGLVTQFVQIDRSKADLITAVDNKDVRTMDEFLSAIEAHKPGEQAILTVVRNGQAMNVRVTLDESRR
ncbi:MAG: trypsin-like peptidase domain-containing protein [Zavarzinella sp.]